MRPEQGKSNLEATWGLGASTASPMTARPRVGSQCASARVHVAVTSDMASLCHPFVTSVQGNFSGDSRPSMGC